MRRGKFKLYLRAKEIWKKCLESKSNFMREIKFKDVFRPSAEVNSLFFYIWFLKNKSSLFMTWHIHSEWLKFQEWVNLMVFRYFKLLYKVLINLLSEAMIKFWCHLSVYRIVNLHNTKHCKPHWFQRYVFASGNKGFKRCDFVWMKPDRFINNHFWSQRLVHSTWLELVSLTIWHFNTILWFSISYLYAQCKGVNDSICVFNHLILCLCVFVWNYIEYLNSYFCVSVCF